MDGKRREYVWNLITLRRIESAEMSGRRYSEYYGRLEGRPQERYRVKLDLVQDGMNDPYSFTPALALMICLMWNIPIFITF